MGHTRSGTNTEWDIHEVGHTRSGTHTKWDMHGVGHTRSGITTHGVGQARSETQGMGQSWNGIHIRSGKWDTHGLRYTHGVEIGI